MPEQLMYKPVIFIGLGGTGSDVVKATRKRMLTELKGEDATLVDSAFRFFSVDTHPEGGKAEWDLAPGHYHSIGVNDGSRLCREMRDHDPTFGTWWPETYTDIGPLVEGAGTVPIKGRLAYRNDLARHPNFIDRLRNAVDAARLIRHERLDTGRVWIYIVNSLCGGTGSGIALSVAHEARHRFRDVEVFGVFVLSDIIKLLAQPEYYDQFDANCFAGLLAIDFWQQSVGTDHLQPFFPLNLPGGHLRGGLKPFDLCYVFTRHNQANQTLASYDEYIRLIAEGLALQVLSPTGGDRLNDFLTRVRDRGEVHSRPAAYASFGVASLRYPVDRIVRFLALKYGGLAVDNYFLSVKEIRAQTDSLAREFMRERAIREINPENEVTNYLKTPRPQDTGLTFPAPLDFKNAFMKKTGGELERFLEERIEQERARLRDPQAIQTRRPTVLRAVEANRQLLEQRIFPALHEKVTALLTSGDDSFLLAAGFVENLSELVTKHRKEIVEEKEGNPLLNKVGFDDEIRNLELRKRSDLQVVIGEYGRRRGRVDDRKRDFITNWWKRWCDLQEQSLVWGQAITFYDNLVTKLETYSNGFQRMRDILQTVRSDFARDEPVALGGRRGVDAYVLETAVLDDPEFLGQQFSATAVRRDFARGLVQAQRGIAYHLHRLWDLLDQSRTRAADQLRSVISQDLGDLLLEYGQAEFREKVERLSLWDALELEATQLEGLPDERVEEYISDRVRHVARQCDAFWLLNADRLRAMGHSTLPVLFTGYSQQALEAFISKRSNSRFQINDVISVARGQAQPVDLRDPHALTISFTEGHAPLFLLGDVQSLYSGFQTFRNVFGTPVFVDRRYDDGLPHTFEPVGEQNRFLFLLAEHLNVIGSPLKDRTLTQYMWSGRELGRTRQDVLDRLLRDVRRRRLIGEDVLNQVGDDPPAIRKIFETEIKPWLDQAVRDYVDDGTLADALEQDRKAIADAQGLFDLGCEG